MPPLTDPERLAAYRDALCNEFRNWELGAVRRTGGNWITFDQLNQTSLEFIWQTLLLNHPAELVPFMYDAVIKQGTVPNEIQEQRPNWKGLYEIDFYYELIIPINVGAGSIRTYIEQRLVIEQGDPRIYVVSVHRPSR